MTQTTDQVPGSRLGRAARGDPSRTLVRLDLAVFGFVAIGVMAAYLAIQLGVIDTWDGKAMASVGQNLLQNHSLKECCNAYGAFPRDPGPYAKFGVGFSLVLAPLWHFQLVSNPNGAVWLGLANASLLTATTLVIVRTGLALGWRRSSAVLAALAFALLTMAPQASSEFFSEPGVTFGSSLLILGLVMWLQRAKTGPPLVGIGTAVAILFRPDSIILLGPIVLLMLAFQGRGLLATWRSWILQLAIPIGLTVAWTLYYDWLRYGKPFQVGYSGVYDTRGFSTPLMHGVALLIWSPGKSFFVYSPILIAALPGIVWLARRRWRVAIVIAAMFVLRVAFYARWWTPEGGNSWGPRFLLPLCAVLAIPLGETLERLHTMGDRARRTAVVILGALAASSVVVQLSALLVSYRDIFVGIYDFRGIPLSLTHTVFAQREHRYLWTLGGNHIVWNLQHIGSRQVHSPLYWFHHGATAFGLGMVVLAAIMCAAAIATAFHSDRIERGRDASSADGLPPGEGPESQAAVVSSSGAMP
jgi:hypothetical protein